MPNSSYEVGFSDILLGAAHCRKALLNEDTFNEYNLHLVIQFQCNLNLCVSEKSHTFKENVRMSLVIMF